MKLKEFLQDPILTHIVKILQGAVEFRIFKIFPVELFEPK
jgi:hypothetical protein